MVCTSDKQHLLDNIETAIMHSLMVESKMQLDLMDVDATWHPNDDLEESDDDMFDHAVSFTLIRTYDIISLSRYTVECPQLPQQRDPLINMLDRYAVSNCKLFRGAVCMTPDAFQALTYRLSTTNAFRSTSSFRRVQQQVAVGLYRLGQSGNGGGVCDIAFACGCSQGSVHKWTDRTIAGLYKLNSEVVTFATEDECAKAKAWLADKSGVEEWSRGWLVVDGTHINLAWKPALNACEHYSYKGDYTFNIAIVFLIPCALSSWWLDILGHHMMHESGLQAVVLLPSLVCILMKVSLSGLMLVMATPATWLDCTATLQLQRAEISTTSTIHSPAFLSRQNMALPTSRTTSNVSWVFEATCIEKRTTRKLHIWSRLVSLCIHLQAIMIDQMRWQSTLGHQRIYLKLKCWRPHQGWKHISRLPKM
ncbi:uncharacterized protein UBRO_20527 [Ustilago bromivora]|uniref:DDE Tnp4 domain-containing protein n=1 Tax=Ustilago bromivora TaxID=307758 RepID=A0A1K0H8L8_9BASI|nr:uncharacterized protein UBRO_20527 [Ustilago bromivora]